jgi:protoheme IX farnesyltransferase
MTFHFLDKLKHYFTITKPGITRAQILTVSIGFFLANQTVSFTLVYFFLILGTYFFSSSACAANSLMERDVDALMARTKDRPLPRGEVSKNEALGVIIVCFLVGSYCMFQVNALALSVALLTFGTYVFAYTPIKKYSWLNTPVGAIPGALPLLGGWFAANAPLHVSVISLFFTLFCWQIPHFYALSIMYYDDYKAGHLKMLPLYPNGIQATKRQIVFFSILMILSSLYPFFTGFLSLLYCVGMIILSTIFFVQVIRSLRDIHSHAKKLFILSIIYLPIWLMLIMVDILIS